MKKRRVLVLDGVSNFKNYVALASIVGPAWAFGSWRVVRWVDARH